MRGGPRPGPGPRDSSRGRGNVKQVLSRPKMSNQQRVINLKDKPQQTNSKQWMPSDRRLKVRNFNEKEVSNEDLRKLFSKIGELQTCVFDRNNFGEFLGSATVSY